jgi:hypothetical protein
MHPGLRRTILPKERIALCRLPAPLLLLCCALRAFVPVVDWRWPNPHRAGLSAASRERPGTKAARERKALSRAATRRRRAATQEENKTRSGKKMGGKRTGTRPKEGDDVSGREENCQTGHRGGDPRDAIPRVRSGSCVTERNRQKVLSRPV